MERPLLFRGRSTCRRKTVLCFVELGIVLLLFCTLLAGCRSQETKNQPAIEFRKIPPAAQGGRERIDTIAGRVTGAHTGEKIVIYAKSGPWWVQPWPDQAFIAINADSTWSTTTHLGYQYAAMLVEPGYHPPPTMDDPPTQGGSVTLVRIVDGVGSLPPHPTVDLRFSGYDWKVQTVSAVRGGLNNLYDADNVWTDASGAMHLRIAKKEKGWTCAHVKLSRSLGYGTYRFALRDTSNLEPAVVMSMHTFDEFGAEQHYREMDVEIGHWGDAKSKENAQYGLQPFYVPGNVAQFHQPAGTMTHTMVWEPGRVSFRTVRGASPNGDGPVISQHVFTSGIPTPGQELLEFMLYFVASDTNPLEKGAEVVVEKFEYLP
jgi:hypothetical protein